ncbi:MAG: thermonuclease family protein [Bacteroidales bacterium]|nr:thermonuclease family protein [Bacteroidales bacterium]
MRFIKIILLITLLAALQPAASGQTFPAEHDGVTWYTVTRVVDGDTFWIDDGSSEGLKIRLIGVDAPEPRNSGKKLKGYFGSESSGYLAQLIEGRKVRLEYDVSRYDRYGRTLAYVYLDDGTFVNADLVRKGYATVMTMPPNVRYADEFVRLAEKARKQKKGLWKPDPSPHEE